MPGSSAYLVCLLIAGAVGALFLWFYAQHKGIDKKARAILLPVTIILMLYGARLFYFVVRIHFVLPMYGWADLPVLYPEGMALGGAVLGLLLAGWLTGKATKLPAHALLDVLAPAGMLTLALSRLGEYFVPIGQGGYVESAALQFFPLAVVNEYGEWYWAVFMLEALVAALIFVYLLRMKPKFLGERWQQGLLLLMLTQIFCESLRAEALKWGFVKVHQLAAAVGLAFMMGFAMRRAKPERLWPYPLALFIDIGLMVGIEFALDKWQEMPHWALYLAFMAILFGLYQAFRGLFRLRAQAPGAVPG